MELDRRGAELLFQVLSEREEKNSVAIASNESFGGWTKTFTDPRLCAAIVDRLTFNGTIIGTGTDSYRLASTRARAEAAASQVPVGASATSPVSGGAGRRAIGAKQGPQLVGGDRPRVTNGLADVGRPTGTEAFDEVCEVGP